MRNMPRLRSMSRPVLWPAGGAPQDAPAEKRTFGFPCPMSFSPSATIILALPKSS
jgi:hypothetical protein